MRTPPVTLVGGAFRFELAVLRRSPGDLLVLVNTPLLTVAFLMITRHAGRPDLDAYAVLAPAVMALWHMAVLVSGEIVDRDRWAGTLELLLAAPAALPLVVLGRILAVTLISLVSLAEAWLVAWLGFGVRIAVHHPGLFVVVLLATAVATAGWATAMSGTFVLARSARTFQNGISYPFYLLGGALVPVDLLPAWLQPISRAVYLSWASDLLRASLRPEPVPDWLPRIGMVVGLGAAGFAVGYWLLNRIVNRVRATGAVTYA
jgi:ABC-2 type transport system permease protein